MNVKTSNAFRVKFSRQVFYIAQDKPKAAKKFKNDVLNEIRKIPKMPFSYRQSIFFKEKSIRDLIFKGYVITFRINDNFIEVFGFNKYQDG